MGLKIVQCPQHLIPQLFVSPKPTSPIVSPSSLTHSTRRDLSLSQMCRFVLSGAGSATHLLTASSFSKLDSRGKSVRRACSGSFEEFCGDDLTKPGGDRSHMEANEEQSNSSTTCTIPGASSLGRGSEGHGRHMPLRTSILQSELEFWEPLMLGIRPDPPDWPEREVVMRANIERKANSMELPLSLRMIKKKHQWREGSRDLGQSAACSSVSKAFSSMMFIIVELQSNALRMREVLCYEDLEGIVGQVEREMHTSFAWLFQQVFSRTPSLMLCVMILLANFSAHSIANDTANHDSSLPAAICEMTGAASATERQDQQQSNIDSSAAELFPASLNHGTEEKVHPGANQTGGVDSYLGKSSLPIRYPNSAVDDTSQLSPHEEPRISEEEARLWSSVVDEAKRMQAEVRDDVLDQETMKSLTAPVSVEAEPDNYMEYFRTDLQYQMELSLEPGNPLLLCNYGQFLFLFARDYDRAEECFQRALQIDPQDPEALTLYANFLWIARKDVWGAEEKHIQAMAVDPDNAHRLSMYANFLWSSGGEETCFPLDTP